jgi:enoyl-CoA hydratase/carnithine racemase
MNAVVPAAELDAACLDLLRRGHARQPRREGAGQAGLRPVDLDQWNAYAIELMAATSQTPAAREGMHAFVEKRAPRFD